MMVWPYLAVSALISAAKNFSIGSCVLNASSTSEMISLTVNVVALSRGVGVESRALPRKSINQAAMGPCAIPASRQAGMSANRKMATRRFFISLLGFLGGEFLDLLGKLVFL